MLAFTQSLHTYLHQHFDFPASLFSRVSKIEYLPNRFLFLKREDELGNLAIGSKNRKMALLRSYLLQNNIQLLLLEGSQHSNFVLSCLILCKELDIDYRLFLHHQKRPSAKGQAFWIQTLADEEKVVYLPFGTAAGEMKNIQKNSSKRCFIVKEGFKQLEGFWAGCHLGLEINQQIKETKTDALFLDAGTGVTAMGAIFALAPILTSPSIDIHIHLIAGNETAFLKEHEQLATAASEALEIKEKPALPNINFAFPPTAKSFGAVNSGTKKFLLHSFQQYGLLLDPIYGVKHLMTTFQTLKSKQYQHPICVLNSGSFGLQGFPFGG